ncbi:hypothetical protein CK556_03505 [Mesoplasma chauliocola]|uniref:PTS EIIA type-1 domain-containing protein n=1 Tax=Mesoplasma chauliocola TaxID=216427 RepID=A0A249SP49_9MOLU|nr:PTS glucose transporter subunit IIA [Mesoplasma chauliocola]ASZ09392.1 hypothetical protein CK556_03505 [Mesoplasma chauliocola]
MQLLIVKLLILINFQIEHSHKNVGWRFTYFTEKNKFISPFIEAKTIMIFETKHSYGFHIEGINVLIHCGLENVRLGGRTFKTKLELDKKLRLCDELFDVNLKYLKEKNISAETPITFDKQIQIKSFKEGNYKQGELICTIKFIEEIIEKDNANLINLIHITIGSALERRLIINKNLYKGSKLEACPCQASGMFRIKITTLHMPLILGWEL